MSKELKTDGTREKREKIEDNDCPMFKFNNSITLSHVFWFTDRKKEKQREIHSTLAY